MKTLETSNKKDQITFTQKVVSATLVAVTLIITSGIVISNASSNAKEIEIQRLDVLERALEEASK